MLLVLVNTWAIKAAEHLQQLRCLELAEMEAISTHMTIQEGRGSFQSATQAQP